jgi:hypothetical protein
MAPGFWILMLRLPAEYEKAYQVDGIFVAGPFRIGRVLVLRAVLFHLALLLFSHLSAEPSLELVQAHHLVRGEHATHAGAYAGLKSYLVGLGGGEVFDMLVDLSLVELLAADGAVERLPGLPETAAGRYYLVLV